ncbi:MAG: DICT sensory domain-containing protein [Acidimicrobiales bacterium]
MAARSGVSVPVLRAWERRFGFPVPERLPSGHRRYTDAEVLRVQRVVAARAAGRSLESAIDLARTSDETQGGAEGSVFATLHRARPDLSVAVLGRRTMLAVSRAIEDECRAQAEHAHLVAAFQKEALYRTAHRRWDDLATSSASTIVFADFEQGGRSASGAYEIPIAVGSPLHREWAVVCDAPAAAAVLAGWERPQGDFEAIWTVDPAAVRQATLAAHRLAATQAPGLQLPPPPSWGYDVEPSPDLRRATAVTNRIVAYLDR